MSSKKKIIIDSANEEEIRIAILNNDELEEYEFEVENKEEVKGNIYLARVTRIESSLQAAFVDYGRSRQGFLSFNEISIDDFCIDEEKKEQLKESYRQSRQQKRNSRRKGKSNSGEGTTLEGTSEDSNASLQPISSSKAHNAAQPSTEVKEGEIKPSASSRSSASSAQPGEAEKTHEYQPKPTTATRTVEASTEGVPTLDIPGVKFNGNVIDLTTSKAEGEEKTDPNLLDKSHLDDNVSGFLHSSSSDHIIDLTKPNKASSSKAESKASKDTNSAPKAPTALEAAEEDELDVDPAQGDTNKKTDARFKKGYDPKKNSSSERARASQEFGSQYGASDSSRAERDQKLESSKIASKSKGSEAPNSDHLDEETSDREEYTDSIEQEYLDYGTRFGYKIDDVIQKNQYILVQVVKDERGNKGAYLTTNLSIPGRYCVYMPRSYSSEGGISKKIPHSAERTRLKDILKTLDLKGNLIIRTAGVDKTEAEIKQDYSYLSNLWQSIQQYYKDHKTPGLIYEEATLINKLLRDTQFDEIHVNNKNTYYNIKKFTEIMSPDLTSKVKLFQAKGDTIFSYFGIEEQVKSIYSPIVLLKSGGYLVIHPTEALTAIDINSGRFKSNKNVEETALRNNLEAAKEIAKQLRLRNLGGLIVIDFIDMENSKNRQMVEKKLRDEVKTDKARIQIGSISSFGLLEMARQHVSSSLFEKNFVACPKCQGMGYLRPLDLNSLQILRDVKNNISTMNNIDGKEYKITVPSREAFYILNNKRHELNSLEEFFNINLTLECNDDLSHPFYEIKEVNTSSDKGKNPTVLLLETEIANKLKARRDQGYSPSDSSTSVDNASSGNNSSGGRNRSGGRKKFQRRNSKRPGSLNGSNRYTSQGDKSNTETYKRTASTQKQKKGGILKRLFGLK